MSDLAVHRGGPADLVVLEITATVVDGLRRALNCAQAELRYEASQSPDPVKRQRYEEHATYLSALWAELGST